MRLLNTRTGEFEWHSDPKKVRYAILSHVWRTPEECGEQTFDDVRRIQAAVKADQQHPSGYYTAYWFQFPSYPRSSLQGTYHWFRVPSRISVIFSNESPLSDKIKGLCMVARNAGFDLVWNDTCCIDKSSSAELSEAINSMYEWYRLSDMCYVYLADVPDGDDPKDRYSKFWESKWHTRGWTLQELIAPERIEFLTSSWRSLGTKLGLAITLAEITRIDVNILLGQAPVQSASVAQRMSWAAWRETTRVEDWAYSLMGLFGVHMSPIYGEGTNAFLRLQEEVIRTIPDQSIFAWQPKRSEHYDGVYSGLCLLASSPTSFHHSTARPTTPSRFVSRLNLRGPEEVPPLDCTFAPQGSRIRLLCVSLTEVRQRIPGLQEDHMPSCVANEGLYREADRLALLQCEDKDERLAGLAFHSSDIAGDGRGSRVGHLCKCSGTTPFRIVWLSREVLAKIVKGVKPETAEVSLLRCHSVTPPSKSLLPIDSLPKLNLWPGGPDELIFSLSPDSVESLCMLGVTISPLRVACRMAEITLETTLAWRNGDLLHSIPLRLSLELLGRYGWTDYDVKIRFSGAARPSSSVLASGSVATSQFTATDLEVPGDESVQYQRADTDDLQRRYTLARFDLVIRPRPEWPQRARLLRLSLQRAPNGRETSAPNSSRTVFLFMEMSEEHKHIDESSTESEPNSDLECSSPGADASDSDELCDSDIDDSAPITASEPALSIGLPDQDTAPCERMNMEGTPHATAGSQADSSSTSSALPIFASGGGYIRDPADDNTVQGGTVLSTPKTTDGHGKNGSDGSVPPRRGDVTQIPGNIVLETESPMAPLAPAPVGRSTEIGHSGSSEVGVPSSIAVATLGTTDDASCARASGASQRAPFELETSTLSTVPEVVRERRRSPSPNGEPSGSTKPKRARMSNRQQSSEMPDRSRTTEMGSRDGGAHAPPAPPPTTDDSSAAALRRALPHPPPSAEYHPPPVPLLPSHLPTVVSDPADATTAQYATLESVEAVQRENSALRTQVSTMRSEVAALTSQNAALVSQMAAVLQKLNALATAAAAVPSPLARADAT